MHVADRMMAVLARRPLVAGRFDQEEFARLRQVVRLAALLHDVGHGPFSHGSEELFPPGRKHEDYSVAIIRRYFGPVITDYFPNIKVDEVVTLLTKGYLAHDLVFLGRIIDGELDADKLDYLLRDSYYCGVRYGEYDLERVLDTLTVVPVTDSKEECSPALRGPEEEGPSPTPLQGYWLLGIDSDGVQAVEELIFARYWMFIQVYFHKTRRIYDYYLTQFLKYFLTKRFGREVFPDTDHLDEYLALDDSTILEAVKRERASNEWARRIYERDHLSEAFVTLPHHAGLASYMVLTELIHRFLMKYGANPETAYVDERARKLPTNPFFGLKREEDEGDKAKRQFASIMVQDKHQPEEVRSIFELSLPLKLLSEKSINLVRFYVSRDRKNEAAVWCREQFSQIQSKVKKIEEGWT
jgi:HD superfamily phosphohydrolase